MKKFIYLFVMFVITGLSFSSCEQQNLITEPTPDDLRQQTIMLQGQEYTLVYQDKEYTIKPNEEGNVEIADLDPVLAEIWDTGHFVITEEADMVYLYDSMEEVNALTKELYPDADLSDNNENLESRNAYYATLYKHVNLGGQSYPFNLPANHLGSMSNQASSMLMVNYSNRPLRVGVYNWPNFGGGGSFHYNVPPRTTWKINWLMGLNDKVTSAWIGTL